MDGRSILAGRGAAARRADAGRAVARRRVAGLLAGCLLAALAPAAARADDTLDLRHIVALTNESRTKAGLPPVVVEERLMAAARAKLFDMLKQDYFAHDTPDGRKPWTFLQAAGYRYQAAAENLAKGYESEPELQRAWMRSRGHRANILNPLFTEIGVADANGIVVVMFGRPLPAGPR
jgi:uncharacterized protein YkwD